MTEQNNQYRPNQTGQPIPAPAHIPVQNSEPVPVPPPNPRTANKQGAKPRPVQAPTAVKPQQRSTQIKHKSADDLGSIPIDLESDSAPVLKRVGGVNKRLDHKSEFKRPLNISGVGATRCRIFTCKLSADPILVMENNINEWIDNSQVEVKYISQTVGTMEGKRKEENLIVTVWY